MPKVLKVCCLRSIILVLPAEQQALWLTEYPTYRLAIHHKVQNTVIAMTSGYCIDTALFTRIIHLQVKALGLVGCNY